MAQIKIYGHREFLRSERERISDAVHGCSVSALGLPEEKRFHRFIALEVEDFVHPSDRSERYIIVEVLLMSGRTVETRKRYIKELIAVLHEKCGIPVNDIEIVLIESPRENWGIRGQTGDELTLNYRVDR